MQRLLRGLAAVFGRVRWSPPAWLLFIAARLRTGWSSLERLRHERAAIYYGGLALVLACMAGGWAGLHWWENRPQPVWVETTIRAPHPTPLVPDAVPEPLRIQLSLPAARLEDVGQELTRGISVTPAIDGVWRWETDSILSFQPRADWPVGVDYRLALSPELLAPGVRLREPELEFASPEFAASISDLRFYDDPVDPAEKKVVATLSFSHAVDKAELERRIELRMRIEPIASFDDASVTRPAFRVSYDEADGKAYIHSERLALPEREGEVRLALAPGIRAARGGPGTSEAALRTTRVPSVESYFRIQRVSGSEVTNTSHELERVVVVEASAGMRQPDLAGQVDVFLLPRDRPAVGALLADPNHAWTDEREVVPEVLALAERVPYEWLPSEREYMPVQTLRYRADAGRTLYVRVRRGVRSLGGYALAVDFNALVPVREFPRTVQILHDGAILSLSGERKLSILTRNLRAVQFELSRLLPGAIPALVSLTSGRFERPQPVTQAFGIDNVAEVFREVRAIAPDPSGAAQYTSFDFAPFLARGARPQGLFSLRVRAWDPDKNEALAEYALSDERMVLLTDLGLIEKQAVDGSHEVFVMSLERGEPVAGARVEMLGKNGLPVHARSSDAQGRASFPSFAGLEREKTPTVWVATTQGDLSFLPLDRRDRELDLARFDTGGLYTSAAQESLQGFLFSDRGIYRPGEEIHVGAIVKRADWKALPAGLPLEIGISDPRGLEIRRERVVFSPEGFEEIRLPTDASAPTGRYQLTLRLVKEREERVELGFTSVRVEEFQPDRMTIDARFSGAPAKGWLAPGELAGRVTLRNLFGTPAAGARVRGSITLSPWFASLPGYADYRFFDPFAAKKSYTETLGDAETDDEGTALLPLGLERFERASYRVRFLAEGFEPETGRSVAMDASAIVSPLPYLVAWRTDGELRWIRAGTKREVELIAVAPTLERAAVADLSLELVEISTVSVLTRQENGTYAYQSIRKELPRASEKLAIPSSGLVRELPAATPGSFAWLVKDAAGTELNRIAFDVVGEGGSARRVERDAELRLKLERADYAPGDEIELEVEAPYTGAGLVTIERDRVYAAQWFRARSQTSVLKIRVPEALEGNAYVVVSFARALESPEIFASPLSSSAVPFSLRRERRTQALRLDVPERVEPGARLAIRYETAVPSRLAVFAIDEGILQVARWTTPDPLAHFYRKRALEVTTRQILDLVLPEFALAARLSAPGGDSDAAMLAGNLNPFKRKGLEPVAFWSGVVDAPAGPGELHYDLPDHFNGTVRVLAVAVSEENIGTAERRTTVRGPYVLRPTAPYVAAPGDVFDVSALVANNREDAGKEAPVRVSLTTSAGLEVVGEREQTLAIASGKDAPARFRVRALPQLGAAKVAFSADAEGARAVSTVELSVRPLVPKMTTVASGVLNGTGERTLPALRALYEAGRDVRVAVSAAPLGAARGLVSYLDEYPHLCTEQLVSEAFPDLVLAAHPELGRDPARTAARHLRVVRMLQGRQDADGAFALWAPGGDTSDFVTVYATHFLLESRERGRETPPALLDRALARLTGLVHVPASDLAGMRTQAYALYVLARAGRVATPELRALREALDQRVAASWPSDLTAGWLASTYALVKLDTDATAALGSLSLESDPREDHLNYHDALIQRGALLYLLANHFPARARTLDGEAISKITDGIATERFNTLSASFAVLGLEALARGAASAGPARASLQAVVAGGAAKELPLEGAVFPQADVPPGVASLKLRGQAPGNLFYQLVQTGFDREAPAPRANGVEVAREIVDAKGAPVSAAKLGDTLLVRVRVRAPSQPVGIAVIDLLPAGLEVDLGSVELQDRRSLGGPGATWRPDYVDVREDRVVLYGSAFEEALTFTYRVKAVHRGEFQVPPVFAEGIYDRSAQAIGAASQFRVGD